MTTNTPGTSTELRRRPPWDLPPWADLAPWGAQVRSLMDELWPSALAMGDFSPGGELQETDEAFVLELDLPGVDKKDIAIDISGRRVSVRGTKSVKERQGVLRHSTRTTGSFAYEAMLPVPVDDSSVKATLADGVLTVTMPKAPASKATHVEIT
jgi:HSP20 family protein